MSGFAPSSLTGKTLLRIAIGVTLVLVVSATTSHVLMFREIERRARAELADYVADRGHAEGQVFLLARDMQQTIAHTVRERYPRYLNAESLARFEVLFARYADGAIRTRRDAIAGPFPTTGWVHRDTPLTDELKQRLVLFHDVIEQFKPAAHIRFADIFLTAPEQANVGTDAPGTSYWGLNVAADYDQNAEGWVRGATPEENPLRQPIWTGADLDPVWNKLLAGVGTPIDVDGRHIGTIYTDLLIDSLLANLQRSGISGVKHAIFKSDSTLLASTDRMNDISVSAGKLRIDESSDEELRAVWRVAREKPTLPFAGYDAGSDQYFALSQIDGPGWYLAATLPGSLIRRQAFGATQWVLWLGLLSLALVLLVLTAVMRRGVARPLDKLAAAAERIAAGNLEQRIDLATGDELDRLAGTFNKMMQRIREREAEILRQRDALHQSEKLASMGSLLAGVAHELNNPLFVVAGRAMMLENATAGTDFHPAAQKIRHAADRCARIVKTFLAMARQDHPARNTVRIDRLIHACLEVLDYTLQAGGVRVEIERGAHVPDVFGDFDQLHQVFLNLFVNAQQAMAEVEGPRVLRIETRHLPRECLVEVRVSDTGPGIAEELRHRIFDPYFTTKPMGQGTGVGLSVCLGIVQAHGGSVRVATPTCGGAEFIVTLPEAAPASTAIHATDAKRASVPRRVLVVDDELEVRETVRDMLTIADHDAEVCPGAKEALELLEEARFDAVVIDVRMPDIDGIELHRRIADRWPSLVQRMVFMTGDGLSAVSHGAVIGLNRPVIEKPFSSDDLCRVIAQVCGDESADQR